MIGAIAGDVIGSPYERRPTKSFDFPLFRPGATFTDDTVLTVAIADAVLTGEAYATALKRYGREYPDAGYGGSFYRWIFSESSDPYNSWGNGSAMRVSPVGFAFDSVDTVLQEAAHTAEMSHNHPEGVKGAQATALSVYLARMTQDKTLMRREVVDLFGYDLDRTVEDIRPSYEFDISCQGTVPEALIAFLDSDSYEDAIRNAISLGGDSDTLACITGGIAEAYYGPVAPRIRNKVQECLTEDLWQTTDQFCRRYGIQKSSHRVNLTP